MEARDWYRLDSLLVPPICSGAATCTVAALHDTGTGRSSSFELPWPLMPVHTHYDNLKVTRKAPLEVIRAAYRAMAQKYHPDMNPSAGATEVMRILNEAWEVLRDPAKRAAHDSWIAEQEALETQKQQGTPGHASGANWTDGAQAQPHQRERNFGSKHPQEDAGPRSAESTAQSSSASMHGSNEGSTADQSVVNKAKERMWNIDGVWLGLGVVVAIWWFSAAGGFSSTGSNPPASLSPTRTVEAPVPPPGEPNYARCAGSYEPEKCRQAERLLAAETPEQSSLRRARLLADTERARELVHGAPAAPSQPAFVPFTGELDPAESPALLQGPSRHLGRVLAQGGYSVIEIDNSNGHLDAEVRLYRDGKKPHVRAMLVRKGTSFKSSGISPGSYVVRWRMLGSQEVFQADQRAVLQEHATENGHRYSQVRMTLYQVQSGNLRTSPVPGSQF